MAAVEYRDLSMRIQSNDPKKIQAAMRCCIRTGCDHPILVDNLVDTYNGEPYSMYAPCGQCENCRNNKSNQLMSRLFLEANELKHAYFITLTYKGYQHTYDIPHQLLDVVWHYDNLNSTKNFQYAPCQLSYAHVQDFIAKMRVYLSREYEQEVRLEYFCAGEYGAGHSTIGGRPHWHLILVCSESLTKNLINKCWSIDGHSLGKVDYNDLFANHTMDGIALFNSKKCFKYVAKYCGKFKPYQFNYIRLKLAYDYFFKEIDGSDIRNVIVNKRGTELVRERSFHKSIFNNFTDEGEYITLHQYSIDELSSLYNQILDLGRKIRRGEDFIHKYEFSRLKRERDKVPMWLEKLDKYNKELDLLVKEFNLKDNYNKRKLYVNKKGYVVPLDLRHGIENKVFAYEESNLFEKICSISFEEYCKLYRQCGHISTGNGIGITYYAENRERFLDGNRKLAKGNFLSTSVTANHSNSKMDLVFPSYYNKLLNRERNPWCYFSKTLKGSTSLKKITLYHDLKRLLSLYEDLVTYTGSLNYGEFVEVKYSHLSVDPSMKSKIGYVTFVGPYFSCNGFGVRANIIYTDNDFARYLHKYPVVFSNDYGNYTYSGLYNSLSSEHYRLVIGKDYDNSVVVKFAVYQYDRGLCGYLLDRYESFYDVYNSIKQCLEDCRGDYEQRRADIDFQFDLINTIRSDESLYQIWQDEVALNAEDWKYFEKQKLNERKNKNTEL